MRIAACLVLLGACTTDSDPDVRIERQSATVADAKADAWAEGGAVLVAAPGTFSFPQPLALRISIVDSKVLDAEGAPTQLTIKTATLATFETANTLEVVSAPACSQNFCTAELKVTGSGSSMLTISATGPEGDQKDCFYFGVYEEADPAAAGATYREDLEAKQADCRAMYWR
jgi:hypothetical protein